MTCNNSCRIRTCLNSVSITEGASPSKSSSADMVAVKVELLQMMTRDHSRDLVGMLYSTFDYYTTLFIYSHDVSCWCSDQSGPKLFVSGKDRDCYLPNCCRRTMEGTRVC